ncbi:polysaccharide biosynthesis tyrosine autokinase [Paraglaciecola aquimarina]|uniref:non-specific protein-tyrosine kinase n=1 Tax=Paraglaciecola aquimarina TaxID=1235557 RepID=A0ABU3T185_9ALTE|nr:polysaccharide biosynthesis tyrosine autokinase [Paraglaciecola aquimarina]MDU0356010.1 polysaccharide biosynthesis tyrosine autokinase [Paraglaciecola aquimarina]
MNAQTRDGQIEAKLFENDTIDLGQYWRIVMQFKWRIVSLSVLITILVALIVMTITPRYIATAKLLIESNEAKVLSIEEVYGLDASRKEYFQTQYEILRSRKVAENVVRKLNLSEQANYNFELRNVGTLEQWKGNLKEQLASILPFLPQKPPVVYTPERLQIIKQNYAVSQVMKSLKILPISNTQIVNISYEDEDPELAALIANTVGDVYIESYLQARFDMTEKATTWLNESLEGLRTKLTASEKLLSDFYESEQLVNIDGVVGLASEELQKLSQQLLDAQTSLKQNEVIYNQVEQSGANIAELSTLTEVINHPSVVSVKRSEVTAQSRVSELSKVYGPKHPQMIAANAELESIQASLAAQIKELVSGITVDYRNASQKVVELKAEVERAKQRFRQLSNLDNRSKTLQREVDVNQQLYSSFFTRLKETNELGGFESANARLLDVAQKPSAPAKPKKGLIIAAAFIVSLGFGIFLAIVLDALNSGIRSLDDVERKLSQRMLGLIPWEPHKRKENIPLRHFFDSKHHTFSESVRTLRTSLQLLNIDKPSKTILVASSVPKEGKSTVAINLGFALGQLHKVLIVDTDLRRPTLAKQFDLPGFQPGIANLIAGTHKLDECIVHDEYSGVDLICAGTIPNNPQELLASEQFKKIMKGFAAMYEYIVVDSAPIQAVSDAVVVSNVCDSIIYVVKSDSTSHKMINSGLSRFISLGHRVDGIVLNQVDLKKAKKQGEYSGFYDQYGYNNYQSETKKA